jgi:hypothetical protein
MLLSVGTMVSLLSLDPPCRRLISPTVLYISAMEEI